MYSFKTITGEIQIDYGKCPDCRDKPCIAACKPQVFKEESGLPVLAIDAASVSKGKCIECLACELECQFHGRGAIKIFLPLPSVD